MNSPYEQRYSLSELKERNSLPPQNQHPENPTPNIPVQPIVIQCCLPKEMEQIRQSLRSLERNVERQTELLSLLWDQSRSSGTSSQLYAIHQTLAGMDKSLQQIQWMVRQAGNRNEKRFSLPSLTFPHLKWSPVYGLILISAAALLAILFTWVVLWK